MEKMTKVLRYDNVLTARVSDADFRAVCERADEEGLTRSEYLRYVARMVADDAENAKRGGVLLDGLSMRRLSRELVRWGHHYNQAVHALNTIALLVRRGSPPKPPELEAMLGRALSALEEVEAGRRVLEAALTEVADSIAVRRD